MLHIAGAEASIKASSGKMFPSSLFVSGGSIGVLIGKLLSTYNVNYIYVVIINLVSLLFIYLYIKNKDLIKKSNLNKYNFANKKIDYMIVILLAVLVVMLRAYMSYGIPTMWNKTVFDMVLLYVFMAFGKAIGGLLVDKIGIKKTIFISTFLSLPFILLGGNNMIISLIGITTFSMTMAISLALILSVIKKYPGVAFGWTTIGLFFGSVPVFLFTIKSYIINSVVIAIGTIISYIVLNIISKEDKYD